MSMTTLEDLKHNMCKWPIGDPKHSDFHFCGERRENGRSYCTHHIEQAYRTHSGGQSYKDGDVKRAA